MKYTVIYVNALDTESMIEVEANSEREAILQVPGTFRDGAVALTEAEMKQHLTVVFPRRGMSGRRVYFAFCRNPKCSWSSQAYGSKSSAESDGKQHEIQAAEE